jgi:hypothetical protein
MRVGLLLISLFVFSQGAWAGSHLSQMDSLSQDLFKDLTSDLGSAIGYKALTSEDNSSILGFTVRSTQLGTSPAFASSAAAQTSTPSISLKSASMGGFDVGGFYSSLPSSNLSLIGGEVSYAVLNEGAISPRVSIRGNFTQLRGMEDFDLTTRGLELSVSKGFSAFTPYAGLGTIWIDGETSASGLSNERLTKSKYFLGIKFDLGLMSFSAETEQTDGDATTSATFGVRF